MPFQRIKQNNFPYKEEPGNKDNPHYLKFHNLNSKIKHKYLSSCKCWILTVLTEPLHWATAVIFVLTQLRNNQGIQQGIHQFPVSTAGTFFFPYQKCILYIQPFNAFPLGGPSSIIPEIVPSIQVRRADLISLPESVIWLPNDKYRNASPKTQCLRMWSVSRQLLFPKSQN